MEQTKYKAVIHFNPKEKILEAKTKDEAEREAQDFGCQFEDVGLIDVETVYKDKDACDKHFDFVNGCKDCKEKLRKNVEG